MHKITIIIYLENNLQGRTKVLSMQSGHTGDPEGMRYSMSPSANTQGGTKDIDSYDHHLLATKTIKATQPGSISTAKEQKIQTVTTATRKNTVIQKPLRPPSLSNQGASVQQPARRNKRYDHHLSQQPGNKTTISQLQEGTKDKSYSTYTRRNIFFNCKICSQLIKEHGFV